MMRRHWPTAFCCLWYSTTAAHIAVPSSEAPLQRFHTGAKRLSFLGLRADDDPEQTGSCTCDCCIAVDAHTEVHDVVGHNIGASSLVCAPRSGAEAIEATSCVNTCAAPTEIAQALGYVSEFVDYWKYCSTQCAAVGEKTNDLCVPLPLMTDAGSPDKTDTAAETVEAPAEQAPEEEPAADSGESESAAVAAGPTLELPGDLPPSSFTDPNAGSEAEVVLAEALKNKARDHAVRAGEAARTAYDAYMAILEVPEHAAVEATKGAIDGLMMEAREQASEAAARRAEYEKNATTKAEADALAAAAVYRHTWEQYMNMSLKYDERAEEFATAANLRADMAFGMEATAEASGQHSSAASIRASAQAKRAEDEAALLRRKANETAQAAINMRAMEPWFIAAREAAAAHAFHVALPEGVNATFDNLTLPAWE